MACVPSALQEERRFVGLGGETKLNIAVTFLDWVMENVQFAGAGDTVHEDGTSPDQPAKVEPEARVAVRVTEVPEL